MRSSRKQSGPGFAAGFFLGLAVGGAVAYVVVFRLMKKTRRPEGEIAMEAVAPAGPGPERTFSREQAEGSADGVIGMSEMPTIPESSEGTRE